ncbi:MAG: retroviral-like aspartic protease family protein [Tannerellaceae bacterium]|nr:retroviral-like aspartic protease family protein [Tannerellaceae bacterium]
MKKIILTSVITLLCISGFAQSADEQVADCLNTSDFFLLEEIYPNIENEIQLPMLKTFAESLLYTSFNQPDRAIATIDSLFSLYQEEIGLDNVKNMLIPQSWLLLRKGEYQNGYERLNSFIETFEPHVPDEFLAHVKSSRKLFRALLDEQKPRLIRPDTDCIIPFETDTIKIKENESDSLTHSTLMFVPVVVNNIEERFIFDTGCGGGVFLSQEYANRLGVRIKMDSLLVLGVGGRDYGQIGILDSLQVGNMTFKNVVATIVPPNPQVDSVYRINAVLGEEIMVFAGEVQIFPQEKKIVFPINQTPLPATGRNMMRVPGGDAFYLKTYYGDERLIMLFDTGDAYSGLNENFYANHKEFVELNGTKRSRIGGGFGGVIEKEFYTLPSFPFRIGNTPFEISHINVEFSPNDIQTQFDSGSLGMAFVHLFNKVTINFDNMFVEVEY